MQVPALRKLLKLDIEAQLVEQLRVKYNEDVPFREILDEAVKNNSEKIDKLLGQAGFREKPKSAKSRVWPVSTEAIECLDKIAVKRNVSRAELIRAVLILHLLDQ